MADIINDLVEIFFVVGKSYDSVFDAVHGCCLLYVIFKMGSCEVICQLLKYLQLLMGIKRRSS